MSKFSGLVLVVLVVLLAGSAPPAKAVITQAPASTSASTAAAGAVRAVPLLPFAAQAAPPGPILDPAGTAQADREKTKNKLIAGGVAIGLLLIVIWGRRVRMLKRKKITDQAKGK